MFSKCFLVLLIVPWIFLACDGSPRFVLGVVNNRVSQITSFWHDHLSQESWIIRSIVRPLNVVVTGIVIESDLISLTCWEVSGWFRFHPLLSFSVLLILVVITRRPWSFVKRIVKTLLIVALFLIVVGGFVRFFGMASGGLTTFYHSLAIGAVGHGAFVAPLQIAGQRVHAQLVPPAGLLGGNDE